MCSVYVVLRLHTHTQMCVVCLCLSVCVCSILYHNILCVFPEITGNAEIGFKEEDLEGDFDPEKFDEAMQSVFNDDYYGHENDTEKPVFSDSEGDGMAGCGVRKPVWGGGGVVRQSGEGCYNEAVWGGGVIIGSLGRRWCSEAVLIFCTEAVNWDLWAPGNEEQDGGQHCEDPDFNVSRVGVVTLWREEPRYIPPVGTIVFCSSVG